MIELTEIAAYLNELYRQRAVNLAAIQTATEQLEYTKAMLVPIQVDEGGRIIGAAWPGGNDKARDAVRDAVYAHDSEVNRLSQLVLENKNDLVTVNAMIDGAEADRRALEWSIRAKQVDFTIEHIDEPAEDPLDTDLQNHLDVQSFGDVFDDRDPEDADPVPYDPTDIPF